MPVQSQLLLLFRFLWCVVCWLRPGMGLRKAQCNDNRVPGLRLRDTIRVPGISGTRLRDTTQGHDRVPYRVPIVSLIRVP